MALAGRSPRRAGGGRKILIVAVLVTLVVLLIDASIKSRSTGPGKELAAQAWVDRALPIIRDSTEQGQQIESLASDGLTMTAPAITAQADRTAAAARATYAQAVKLSPPATVSTAAGLLDAALLVRSQAAATVAKVMVGTLSGPATAAAAAASSTALAASASSFAFADKAYVLFTKNLPNLGVTPPPSVWAANPALFQNPRLTTYLQALRNATSLTPVHQLQVVSLATNPGAESLAGNVQILPLQSSISVAVVVGNTGNQTEKNLTVTASISPAVRAPSAREFITSLSAGGDQALTIGALDPVAGTPVVLTVRVTGTTSGLAPATQTLTFEMPKAGQAIPTTTTTTVAPPAATTPTTVAGGKTGTGTTTTVPAATTTTVGGG
jgi:ribosomal protein S7